MDEADRYSLDYIRPHILENLDAKHVVDYLIETEVLEPNHDEEIRAEKTAKRRTEKLLEILPDTHPEALRHFREALQKDYGHIVKRLDAVKVPNQFRTSRPIPGMGGLCTATAAATDTRRGATTTTTTRNNVTSRTTNIQGNNNFVIIGGKKTTINNYHSR